MFARHHGSTKVKLLFMRKLVSFFFPEAFQRIKPAVLQNINNTTLKMYEEDEPTSRIIYKRQPLEFAVPLFESTCIVTELLAFWKILSTMLESLSLNLNSTNEKWVLLLYRIVFLMVPSRLNTNIEITNSSCIFCLWQPQV